MLHDNPLARVQKEQECRVVKKYIVQIIRKSKWCRVRLSSLQIGYHPREKQIKRDSC